MYWVTSYGLVSRLFVIKVMQLGLCKSLTIFEHAVCFWHTAVAPAPNSVKLLEASNNISKILFQNNIFEILCQFRKSLQVCWNRWSLIIHCHTYFDDFGAPNNKKRSTMSCCVQYVLGEHLSCKQHLISVIFCLVLWRDWVSGLSSHL